MTGFKGAFAVNFELPDFIGLGKAVSRASLPRRRRQSFGTVRRIVRGRKG